MSSPEGIRSYLLGTYRIATAPEPNSSRLTSFKSTDCDRPANNDVDGISKGSHVVSVPPVVEEHT